MEKKHIICFGDSNTHGYCAETDGRFDENTRWTCLLQAKLGDEYLILEEGLGGRTTCFDDPTHEGLRGLDYISPCLQTHEPVDLLIIMLGTNDTKERFGCSAESLGNCISHWYRLIAGQTGCHYFDANTVVSENTPKDFIHLSKKGHAELANALAGFIPSLFQ